MRRNNVIVLFLAIVMGGLAAMLARNQSPAVVQKRLASLATQGETFTKDHRPATETPQLALLHR